MNVSAELSRLRVQTERLAVREIALLRELGLDEATRIADVGCGPGFFAECLAEALPEGREVIGVDVDPNMIDVARGRCADRVDLSFLSGTAQRLPLEDDSVDLAYARFLFQHLSEPTSVLAEMRRIVRPGGLVIVGDTDDGGLVAYPVPDGFEAFLEASHRAQRSRGGDRRVGRKLRSLFLEQGLVDVNVRAELMTTEEIGPSAFLEIAIGFKAGCLTPPFIEPEAVASLMTGLREMSRQPDFFAHVVGYLVSGRVV